LFSNGSVVCLDSYR